MDILREDDDDWVKKWRLRETDIEAGPGKREKRC